MMQTTKGGWQRITLLFVFLYQQWLNWKMQSSLTFYGLKNSLCRCAWQLSSKEVFSFSDPGKILPSTYSGVCPINNNIIHY